MAAVGTAAVAMEDWSKEETQELLEGLTDPHVAAVELYNLLALRQRHLVRHSGMLPSPPVDQHLHHTS